MSDPVSRKSVDGPRGRFRGRLILFVVTPVLLLGVSYFLFIEYMVLSHGVAEGGPRLALRIGGMILIGLALVTALASGYLLADRVSRPIRMLLSFAQTGDLPGGAGLFVHHRDWEVFQLYRRVHSLVQQNRAGAGALDELESLREALEELRTALEKTGQHGVLAPLEIEGGPLSGIADLLGAHRARLIEFFGDLKARAERLRHELDEMEQGRVSSGRVGEERPYDALTERGEESTRAASGVGLEAGKGPNGVARNGAEQGSPGAWNPGSDEPASNDAHPADSNPSDSNPSDAHPTDAHPADVNPTDATSLPDDVTPVHFLRQAAIELRRVGTVMALEIERGRGPGAELGQLYDRFRVCADRMDAAIVGCETPVEATVGDGPDREVWMKRLREDLSSLERCLEEVEER